MILLHVRLTAVAGAEPALAELLTGVAADSRQEAGCEMYHVYRDHEEPSVFAIVESYRDEAALDQHLASAQIARYRAALPDLVAQRVAIRHWVDRSDDLTPPTPT